MMTTVTGKVSTRLGDFARGDRRSPGMIISLPGTGIARFRTESPGERSSIGKKVKVKDRSESCECSRELRASDPGLGVL